jgi:hypothetical protein
LPNSKSAGLIFVLELQDELSIRCTNGRDS